MTPIRLGIFGGSFDPVHNGHLALARACGEQAALDEVWFTPTAVQPLKRRGPTASDAQRLAMLTLATADEPTWKLCREEIDRGGLSYTVDTLRTIHAERPEAALFFLMGADAVSEVPQWKEPGEIFRLATPLVVQRAGESPPDLSIFTPFCPSGQAPQLVDMPAVDASSTEIRRRLAAGESIGELVPPAVSELISAQGIYS